MSNLFDNEEMIREALKANFGIDISKIPPQRFQELMERVKKLTLRCPKCGALAGTFWNYCGQCRQWLPAPEQQSKLEVNLRQQGCKIPHSTLKQGMNWCVACGEKL